MTGEKFHFQRAAENFLSIRHFGRTFHCLFSHLTQGIFSGSTGRSNPRLSLFSEEKNSVQIF